MLSACISNQQREPIFKKIETIITTLIPANKIAEIDLQDSNNNNIAKKFNAVTEAIAALLYNNHNASDDVDVTPFVLAIQELKGAMEKVTDEITLLNETKGILLVVLDFLSKNLKNPAKETAPVHNSDHKENKIQTTLSAPEEELKKKGLLLVSEKLGQSFLDVAKIKGLNDNIMNTNKNARCYHEIKISPTTEAFYFAITLEGNNNYFPSDLMSFLSNPKSTKELLDSIDFAERFPSLIANLKKKYFMLGEMIKKPNSMDNEYMLPPDHKDLEKHDCGSKIGSELTDTLSHTNSTFKTNLIFHFEKGSVEGVAECMELIYKAYTLHDLFAKESSYFNEASSQVHQHMKEDVDTLSSMFENSTRPEKVNTIISMFANPEQPAGRSEVIPILIGVEEEILAELAKHITSWQFEKNGERHYPKSNPLYKNAPSATPPKSFAVEQNIKTYEASISSGISGTTGYGKRNKTGEEAFNIQISKEGKIDLNELKTILKQNFSGNIEEKRGAFVVINQYGKKYTLETFAEEIKQLLKADLLWQLKTHIMPSFSAKGNYSKNDESFFNDAEKYYQEYKNLEKYSAKSMFDMFESYIRQYREKDVLSVLANNLKYGLTFLLTKYVDFHKEKDASGNNILHLLLSSLTSSAVLTFEGVGDLARSDNTFSEILNHCLAILNKTNPIIYQRLLEEKNNKGKTPLDIYQENKGCHCQTMPTRPICVFKLIMEPTAESENYDIKHFGNEELSIDASKINSYCYAIKQRGKAWTVMWIYENETGHASVKEMNISNGFFPTNETRNIVTDLASINAKRNTQPNFFQGASLDLSTPPSTVGRHIDEYIKMYGKTWGRPVMIESDSKTKKEMTVKEFQEEFVKTTMPLPKQNKPDASVVNPFNLSMFESLEDDFSSLSADSYYS